MLLNFILVSDLSVLWKLFFKVFLIDYNCILIGSFVNNWLLNIRLIMSNKMWVLNIFKF